MAGDVRWLTAFVLLALVACAPAPSAPPKPAAGSAPAATANAPAAGAEAAAAGASQAEPTPLAMRRVELAAGAVSATSGPLWVGVDHGHFARYGLEVEVSTLAAATATQAVQSGSVPFAATSASTVA